MDKLVALSCSNNYLALVVLLVIFCLPPSIHSAPITSCSQTPYPQVCNHFMTTTNVNVDDDGYGFLDIALRMTMEQALEAHRLVRSMDTAKMELKLKLAWDDCLEVYEDTVHQLRRSVRSTNHLDRQTWLSAAMANHQTCLNGFLDFDLSSHLQSFPVLFSNFSNLLSNSLAINKGAALLSTSTSSRGRRRLLLDHGFPTWLSPVDRKLLEKAAAAQAADIVVAGDGSGDYKTISEAVAAAAGRVGGGKRVVIHVKAGVYKENVEIKRSVTNLMFIGDGIDATVVTGNKNAQDGSTTYRTSTFGVSGDGFIARDMTLENTAGPQKQQAVALRSGSDKSVFYRCSFKGYQDTLYVYSQRQFYRECDIYGTVDFIFGDAAAVLQGCNIYARKPAGGQKNTVTAQARSDPGENTGIIIHNSRISAASSTYLGRPWKKYSRTVIMKSSLDGMIEPAGWLPWSGSFALSTLYYGEYMNTGASAATSARVKWPGYHVITSAAEAGKFTVGSFLAGGSWIPAAGVPCAMGL